VREGPRQLVLRGVGGEKGGRDGRETSRGVPNSAGHLGGLGSESAEANGVDRDKSRKQKGGSERR